MSLIRLTTITTAFLFLGIFAETCEAGPLLDWMRGNRAYRYNAYYQAPQVAPQGYSQMPGTCTTTCPKTCYRTVNRVVANCVPYTAFRTEYYRVPITYYRRVTSSNPQTGCVTTCMKPCTYYQMQARRVPYTTYQTVYRTVSYRVPYTVYETSYGTSCNSCSSCSSCSTGASAMSPMGSMSPTCASCGVSGTSNVAPAMPSYGLNPNGQYSAPANSVPQLQPSEIQPDTTLQRPVTEPVQPQQDPAINPESNTTNSSLQQPQLNVPANPPPADNGNLTASLVRDRWDYSVKKAGYYVTTGGSNASTSRPSTLNKVSGFSSAKPTRPAFRSSGWKSAR